MFVRTGWEARSACAWRSSGTMPIPARTASRGFRIASGAPDPRVTRPLSIGSAPKIARRVSVRPDPTRPASPRISPCLTSRLTFRRRFPRVNTVHTQRDVAFWPIHVLLERLDCALADHQLDDLAHGSSRGGSRCHDAAVAQHGDAIGDPPNLVQPVADVEDGRSRVAEAPEMSEGQRDLTLREGRGRLVEDEDTARVREGRCERNQLLPANAQPTHGHLRIDVVQPDGGERCRRPRPERCRGHESEATGKIREEQILGDAQRRNEVQLLRHELHARPLRFLPASRDYSADRRASWRRGPQGSARR